MFTRVQHMYFFDNLTKTSIINLMEFTVDSKGYIGWESNLSIIRQKYCLRSFSEHKTVREI